MDRFFMKSGILFLFTTLLWGTIQYCLATSTPPPAADSQGTLFIREKTADVKTFQSSFLNLRNDFKTNGFLAYSLHADLQDPSFLILTLQCSNLAKGLAFLKTEVYKTAMKTTGVKDAVVWCGGDITPRKYDDLPPKPAGIVIARNDVRSYDYWKAMFDQEHNPQHGGNNANKGEGYHEKRDYLPSHYSFHRGLEKHDVVYVVHQASDVSKAPFFMTSQPMRAMQGPLGIQKFTVWYGVNIEQGVF